MSTTEIIPAESTSNSLMKMIERAAFMPDFDVAKLQTMLDMKLRFEANEARLAYIASMHEFRSNPPEINKTKKVSYENKDRSVTTYYHAELDDVVEIISQALRKVDIRPSWKTSDNGGKITVTCVLTHKLGHSEEVATLAGPADTSGGKNNIQAIGSTTTYLQRYTLLAGTGLAAKGQDDDGKTEGMNSDAIDEYVAAMKDAAHVQELQDVFKECYQKARGLNDKQAMGAFIEVYEQRKRELR
jgi:hypothetical protein